MAVIEPPVCPRCSDESDSVSKLEQHVRASKTPPSEIKTPIPLVTSPSFMVSLSHPLDSCPPSHSNSSSMSRPQPAWMSLLPSQRRLSTGAKQQSSNDTAKTQTVEAPRSTTNSIPLANVSIIDLTNPSSETHPNHASLPPSTSSSTTSSNPPPNGRHRGSGLGGVERRDDIRDLSRHDRRILRNARGRRGRRVADPRNLPSDDEMKSTGPPVVEDLQQTNPSKAPRLSVEGEALLQKARFSRRKQSPGVGEGGRCRVEASHTRLPSQDIAAARNPILKELSGFLVSRTGR